MTTTDVTATLPDRVQRWMTYRGISHADLAAALGLSRSGVTRRLRGQIPLRATEVAIIARVLDMPASELLDP